MIGAGVTAITPKRAGRRGENVGQGRPGGVAMMAVPAYLRLPKPKGRFLYTSFSRTTLVELCVPTAANNFRPPVRALCIKTTATKHRGKPARAKKRGIYLIPTAKLFAYLNSQKAKAA